MPSHIPQPSLHERYGVKFSINVNSYQSYTQTDPAVSLDGLSVVADTETAYKQGSGLHSYGKTKIVTMTELQPFVGGGSIVPQNQRGLDGMDKTVQEKIENIRWAFGSRGEIEVDDDGTSLYTSYPDSGAVATVTISDGGSAYTSFGGGAFTTTSTTGGGTGMTGTIDTVSLARLGTGTATWHTTEPNADDPVRVAYEGNSYLLVNYTVTAKSPAIGSGVLGNVTATYHIQGRLRSGTITNTGTNWKIGDEMEVNQSTGSGNGGVLQVDRVASGGGEITAVSVVNNGSNYIVGDTLKIIQEAPLEDGPYGNTCDIGREGELTVASLAEIGTAIPVLEGIYIKNIDSTKTVQLSINDGDYWDVEIKPSQAFFTRLYQVDASDVMAKCTTSSQTCPIEYLLFQGAG